MLSKTNRLQNTKEIERVFKGGKGVGRGFLYLMFLENNSGINRFAFIVSRRVAKKAVQRNKIKRRLRSVIQKKIPRIKTGFDFILMAQKGAENKSFQETEKYIDAIFNKWTF